MNYVRKMIPASWKAWLKSRWEQVFPPRITLTQFDPQGCTFEITTKMERHRVLGVADEAEFLQLFLSSLKKEDVFYDIGSCVGMYALHAARKGAFVYAFEPDPGYCLRLKRNIQINKLANRILVKPWAVSDRTGQGTLYTDGVEGNSPSLALVGERGSTVIQLESIDHAIAQDEIRKATIIKLDIEGAEILALKGMKNLLNSPDAPQNLFIEFHPAFLAGFASSLEECEQILADAGYIVIYQKDRSTQIHRIYRKNHG